MALAHPEIGTWTALGKWQDMALRRNSPGNGCREAWHSPTIRLDEPRTSTRCPSAAPPDADAGARRGGRVVEGARLERVYTGNRIEGSNPSLSAIFPWGPYLAHGLHFILETWVVRTGDIGNRSYLRHESFMRASIRDFASCIGMLPSGQEAKQPAGRSACNRRRRGPRASAFRGPWAGHGRVRCRPAHADDPKDRTRSDWPRRRRGRFSCRPR